MYCIKANMCECVCMCWVFVKNTYLFVYQLMLFAASQRCMIFSTHQLKSQH